MVMGRCVLQSVSARCTGQRTRFAVALAAVAVVGGGARPAGRSAAKESVVHRQRQQQTCLSRVGYHVLGMGLESGVATETETATATVTGCGCGYWVWSALHHLPPHSDVAVARPGGAAFAACVASMMPS